MTIRYLEGILPSPRDVLALYRANGWSSAEKPDLLLAALAGSHHLVTAHAGDRLVGLANAISDGHLVVYYPHLIVHPDRQGQGIGRGLMARMRARYRDMHQHMLVAEGNAVGFYQRMGFERAGQTVAMWIYEGGDHG